MPAAIQYQQLIIAALSTADSEAQADLQARVPALWDLYVIKAAWPDVRYWYTYREAVKLLMGRNRRMIDTTRRRSLAVGASSNNVTADARTQMNAASDATDLAAASTIRNRTHASNGSTTGTTDASDATTRTEAQDSNYYDIGSGSGRTDTYAHKYRLSNRLRYTLNEFGVQGTTTLSEKSTARDYARFQPFGTSTDLSSQETHHEEHFTDTSLGIAAVAHVTNHKTYNDGDLTSRADSTGRADRTHIGGMAIDSTEHVLADSQLDATRTFQANVHDATFHGVGGQIIGNTTVDDVADETGSGSGSMTHNSRHESRGLTLSRTDSHDTTVGASQSLETAQAEMLMQKAQQQFIHLTDLFKHASAQIKTLEQQAVLTNRSMTLEMLARDSNLITLWPLQTYSL